MTFTAFAARTLAPIAALAGLAVADHSIQHLGSDCPWGHRR